MSHSQRRCDGLHLAILLQTILTAFASDAGLLQASTLRGGGENVVAVHPHGARTDAVGDGVRLADIAGPHTGSQAIPGPADAVNHLLKVGAPKDGPRRSERNQSNERATGFTTRPLPPSLGFCRGACLETPPPHPSCGVRFSDARPAIG